MLTRLEVVTAYQMRWQALFNGDLIAAAEQGGFEVLMTGDKNLRYQQNLKGRTIALVILRTTHWKTLQDHAQQVTDAVAACTPGVFVNVVFDRSR